jgi:hypothetical protein
VVTVRIQTLDLNDLMSATDGIVILRAKAINRDGVIIAEGSAPGGPQHALVLRPIRQSEDD